MQRGLVFDFGSDQTALDVADQFMFGDVSLQSSILVLAFYVSFLRYTLRHQQIHKPAHSM